ncbi:anti-sigma B factor RsbW, partial [Bacillus atrophaeus]|nr:anti-sigma B factor RsbW [Bacillus atrophaeus]
MKNTVDYIEMKIPAEPEYVGIVRLTLSGVASRMGYT